MTEDLTQRIEQEIIELHAFFAQWFNGEVARDRAVFARFADVMADDFCMITPTGTIIEREPLLKAVEKGHGEDRADGPFEIEIRAIQPRMTDADRSLVTYEEWQRSRSTPWRGRISSAWFIAAGTTPNGVLWRHLHETWLPAEG